MPADVLLWSFLLAIGLIWTSFVDLRRFIIPDEASLGLSIAGLVATWQIGESAVGMHAIGAASSFLVFAGLAAVYRMLRRREGLGLGDAKLAAAAGAWLGPEMLPLTVLLSCLSAIAALLIVVLMKRLDLSGNLGIAFGPFLAFSIWINWIWGPVI